MLVHFLCKLLGNRCLALAGRRVNAFRGADRGAKLVEGHGRTMGTPDGTHGGLSKSQTCYTPGGKWLGVHEVSVGREGPRPSLCVCGNCSLGESGSEGQWGGCSGGLDAQPPLLLTSGTWVLRTVGLPCGQQTRGLWTRQPLPPAGPVWRGTLWPGVLCSKSTSVGGINVFSCNKGLVACGVWPAARPFPSPFAFVSQGRLHSQFLGKQLLFRGS